MPISTANVPGAPDSSTFSEEAKQWFWKIRGRRENTRNELELRSKGGLCLPDGTFFFKKNEDPWKCSTTQTTYSVIFAFPPHRGGNKGERETGEDVLPRGSFAGSFSTPGSGRRDKHTDLRVPARLGLARICLPLLERGAGDGSERRRRRQWHRTARRDGEAAGGRRRGPARGPARHHHLRSVGVARAARHWRLRQCVSLPAPGGSGVPEAVGERGAAAPGGAPEEGRGRVAQAAGQEREPQG